VVRKKGKSNFSEVVNKLKEPVLDSTVDLVTIDEAATLTPEMFNGLSDRDAKPFSFSCVERRYNMTMDAYDYVVTPDNEYGDLDFKGKTVLINGRERKCDEFTVGDDSHLVITVHCRADD
jgi:hypothetical protein